MKNVVTILLILLAIPSVAQDTFQVTGKVEDEQGKAMDLAMVVLLSASDSSIVKSVYTDQDGSFVLGQISSGDYTIEARMLSYHITRRSITVAEKDLSVPTLVIKANATAIDIAEVATEVPFVERQIDRVIVNPDALPSNAGSNALDIMEKAPGIILNSDGSLLLKGRSGVQVYINDKPSYLSGSELENYLRSLPTGSIQRIEIMENPPAEFDAAGSGGIINIVLKRNALRGFYGNFNTGYRQGSYANSNNNLNVNYNREKVGVYASVNAGLWENYQDLNINRFYSDAEGVSTSSFKQNSFINHGGKYFNVRSGIDLYPSDNTNFGGSFRLNISPTTRYTDNTSIVAQPDGALIQEVLADNDEEETFDSQAYTLYFAHYLDSLGQKISIDADLVRYQTDNDQVFNNFIYDSTGVLTYQDRINGQLPSTIDIYAVKADYRKSLGGSGMFEAGVKSAYTETDNEAIYTNTVDGVTTPDYGLSNRFLYEEMINAAYVNFSKSFEKVDFQLGLRGEATSLKGNQLGNAEQSDSSFTRDYQNLFPTFYSTWRIDSANHHLLSFSYSKRVNRPYFMDLNPFISPLDRFTFYSGNPNLLPTFSNNFSLTYTWRSMINGTFSYSNTIDGINETLEIVDEIYYSRPGNIADSQTFSFSVDGAVSVSKRWRVNFYGEYAYLTFDSPLYNQQLNASGDYQYLSLTNTFDFGKGWKGDISGIYRSDMVYSQLFLRSFGGINIGFQKALWDGKANLKCSVNDILFTRRGDGIINNLEQTEADWNSVRDTRRFALAFSFNFGKATNQKNAHRGSGSDEEQGRVR
ncbi:outer membrane beta-barrel family protein [Sanyastnella coralliicola]|uniref:outer membrane beta-barrel family protein n=1 Tax=Sanyastnella coralliicola TaxID=3069118 RepID=UPI0027BAB97C|nr:outer membrane beta-barrel family protein [Longitalea sp. SCSIO 12813]